MGDGWGLYLYFWHKCQEHWQTAMLFLNSGYFLNLLCFMVRNLEPVTLVLLKLKTQKHEGRCRHTVMEEKEWWSEWAYCYCYCGQPETWGKMLNFLLLSAVFSAASLASVWSIVRFRVEQMLLLRRSSIAGSGGLAGWKVVKLTA